MKSLAAVLVETGKPLEIAELEIPLLKTGQVLVRIAVSGVCHTQILECRGYRGKDKFLPHCLGHEGSGVVEEVGPGVTRVKLGDHVVLSWIKGLGADVNSTQYRWGSRSVNAGGITTFNEYAVISENRLTLLPNQFDMRVAALLGCAVPTGVGTVLNTARPRPGQSLAVLGVGGVGMCAVAGASVSGCTPIVAIDIQDAKLSLAQRMGASHCLRADSGNLLQAIYEICPGGLDFAIEATGRPEVMCLALESVRHQGGTAVIIGNTRLEDRVAIDPRQLNMGKRLLGTWGGDNNPAIDFLRYQKLVSGKKLMFEPLLSNSYRLSEINAALDDLESGNAIRPMIDLV